MIDKISSDRKPHIVIVEDDKTIAAMLKYNLEEENFDVKAIKDGEDAHDYIVENVPDLVILDWMVPSMTGVEICRNLRKNDSTKSLPIILLTARGEEEDRVKGMSIGADDYVVKPFSIQELIFRVYALLKRSKPSFFSKEIEYAGIRVLMKEHVVKYKEKSITPGPIEFKLLKHFIEHNGQVFSRQQLLDNVWEDSIDVGLRTVDVHILRLRKFLNSLENGLGSYIRTIRSFGYKFDIKDEE